MPAEDRWAPLRPSLLAICLSFGILIVSVLLAQFPAVQRWSGDIRLFEYYAGRAFSGDLGATPFLSWYPPLSLIPLSLPLLVGTGPIYAFALGAEMAAVAGVGAGLLQRFRARIGADRRGLLVYMLLTLATTPFLAWRYDIVPAVLCFVALVGLCSGRWAIGGGALGIAAGLKLYAVLLVPLFILWAWRRGGGRAAGRAAAFVAGTGLASVAAYLLFPGASPLDLLAFTAARPLHVETLSGAAISLLASIGIGDARLTFGSGSFNVIAPASQAAIHALRIIQPLLLLATVGVGLAAITREASARVLTTASIAVLLALIISNRVFSPQYLIWSLPFVPLVGGWLRGLLVAAILLTAVVFPWLYSALVDLDPVPLALVVVRDAILVVAWAVATGRLLHLPRADHRAGDPAAAAA